MPRITKLMLLNGQELCSWYDAKPTLESRYAMWAKARLEIACRWECPLSEVGYDEDTPAGECFTVDDEPIAYLAHQFVSIAPVVDLRPLMQAAE
jgi:hypothetical protein